MATITVLTPVGERRQATLAVPPLPADLRGLTVVHRRKANASTAAADEIIEGLAKDCDLVFAGSGD